MVAGGWLRMDGVRDGGESLHRQLSKRLAGYLKKNPDRLNAIQLTG